MLRFYNVKHIPREKLSLEHWAWLTPAQANGFNSNPDELVDVFWDRQGEMVLETVKLEELEVLSEA